MRLSPTPPREPEPAARMCQWVCDIVDDRGETHLVPFCTEGIRGITPVSHPEKLAVFAEWEIEILAEITQGKRASQGRKR